MTDRNFNGMRDLNKNVLEKMDFQKQLGTRKYWSTKIFKKTFKNQDRYKIQDTYNLYSHPLELGPTVSDWYRPTLSNHFRQVRISRILLTMLYPVLCFFVTNYIIEQWFGNSWNYLLVHWTDITGHFLSNLFKPKNKNS